MANLHASNNYNRVGRIPLPKTFDVDFINYISSYLNHYLEIEDQDWESIEREIHADFDIKFGVEFVNRHIEKLKE